MREHMAIDIYDEEEKCTEKGTDRRPLIYSLYASHIRNVNLDLRIAIVKISQPINI